MRGSGATAAYLAGLPLDEVAWRGQWQARRTLEHYLQEVAAVRLLNVVPPDVREAVGVLSALLAPALLTFAGVVPTAGLARTSSPAASLG